MILICVKEFSKDVKEWGMYNICEAYGEFFSSGTEFTASVVYMTENTDLQNTNAFNSTDS